MSPESLDLGRRDFLTTGAAAMAGLIVGFHVPAIDALARQAPTGAPSPLPDPNAFLRIAPDGTVTILLAHSEMGQGVWTGLAMLVAEELGCDWGTVRVEHAPAAPAYFHTLMPMQMTGGSTTTWSEFDRYRQAGALARELLVRAAAAAWGVTPAQCRAENGAIVSGDRRATFGALAEKARALPTPVEIQLKNRSAWTRIGKPTKRLDSPEKVTGRALFGQDVRFDGLKVAVVERAPGLRSEGGLIRRCGRTQGGWRPGRRAGRRRAWPWSPIISSPRARGRGRSRPRSSGTSDPAAPSTRRRCARSTGRWRSGPARRLPRRAMRPRRSRGRLSDSSPNTKARSWRTRRWSRSTAR